MGHNKTQAALIAELQATQKRVVELQRALMDAGNDVDRTPLNSQTSPQSCEYSERSLHACGVAQLICTVVEGRILHANDVFCQSIGCKPDDILGRVLLDLNLGADLEDRQEVPRLLSSPVQEYDRKIRLRAQNGELHTLLFSVEPVEIGGVLCAVSTGIEVTALDGGGNSFHPGEELLRVIAEMTSDYFYGGAIFADGSSRTDWIAGAFEQITAYTPEEILNAPSRFQELILPEDFESVYRHFLELLEKGSITFEYRIRRKDGAICWLRDAISCLEEKGAESHIRLVGAVKDITGQKAAEDALRVSEAKFLAAFENSSLSLGIANYESRFTEINRAFCELVGFSHDEIIGKTISELGIMSEAHRQLVLTTILGSGGHVHNLELQLRARDGRVRDVLYSVTPIQLDGAPHHLGAAVDITDRKKAEAELRASRSEYHALLESLDSAVTTVSLDGILLYVNDSAAKSLGERPEALVGRTLYDLSPESLASMQMASVQRVAVIDRGEVFDVQTMPQGGSRWHRMSFQPIHDAEGRVREVLINATDIHELKTTQQALIELNLTLEERIAERTAQVRDLYDNAPVGYHTLDAWGRFVEVNLTELNWLGYTREDLIHQHISKILTSAGAAAFEAMYLEFKRSGWLRDLEFEVVRKNGATLPVIVNSRAIYDAEGVYLSSRSTMVDNSLRRQAELDLRESEEQNRLLFEESPVALVLLDSEGHIVRANRAFVQLTKMPLHTLLGVPARELGLFSGEVADHLHEILFQNLDERQTAVVQHTITCLDGIELEVESCIFPLKLGGAEHILATTNDVTAYVKAEEALRLANAEMERVMHLKDEFLASVSHDLRTPLNGILLGSEVMRSGAYGPLNQAQWKALGNIEASGQHLLELINDLLDLSKMEAGRLELAMTPVIVDALCREGLSFVQESARKKSIGLHYEIRQPDLLIQADARRLKQMLVNLLDNAIKFTPEGGLVSLEVMLSPDSRVRFAVSDNGPGIPPADIPKLFQPFTRLDSKLTQQVEGTGLGLALVKRLALQHGGDVEVKSAGISGQGSCFTLLLPYLRPSESNASEAGVAMPVSTAPSPSTTQRPRVLVVEDNEVMCDVIHDFLQQHGFRVGLARTGPEAIASVEAETPNIILMDIQLPTFDGIEVIRRLRGDVRFAEIPIVALTALAMQRDRERCLQAGVNAYISKPFKSTELIAVIERLLSVATR